jgi:chorismate--pyruvate lyase
VTHSILGKHRCEPHWQAHGPLARHGATAALLDWLLDPGSLTARLLESCQGSFRVQPRYQGWQRAMLNEAQALGMRPHERCFVREVHLLCGERPWVFARTVIPVRTLTGRRRRLARLGRKPLGAFLFADPHMQRGGIEVAALEPGQPLFQRAVAPLAQAPATIWGRRSAFYLSGHPLLVSEIFLPEIGYSKPLTTSDPQQT